MSEYDVVITGGTVADSAGSAVADLAIRDGRIAAVGRAGSLFDADRRIEAKGMVVVPGGVDPHVHTATTFGEFSTLDTFAISTSAAAWGGTTTIVDFAIPQPAGVVGPLEFAEKRMDMAREAVVDVAFHACVTRADEQSIQDIGRLSQRGLTTVKVFTIYKGVVMLSLDEIYECMRATAAVDGMLLVHAESPQLIEPVREELIAKRHTDAYQHAMSRPVESELSMVRTVIEMLRATGCRGYIVHVSTPEAAIAIAEARMQGVAVWAETCPHYVFLNDAVYRGENGELYICSPPIRPARTAQDLWNIVCAGSIEIWGSDHSCFDIAQKFKYRGDFPRVPNGLPGIELRAPLLFSEGVAKGRIGLERFVAMTATNPARLNGLFPRKGSFAIGSDADVAIYDPNREVTVDAKDMHMGTDYSPFEGRVIKGWPRTILSRGRVVVDEMEFLGQPGWGQVLAAGRPVAP